MGLFNHFPYTNFHELNLDWIIGKIKEFGGKIDEFQRIIDNVPTGESVDELRGEINRVSGKTEQNAAAIESVDSKADANAAAIAGLPDEYPNPNAVTFTGAVSATYDGSAPVTVNIPEGGGELGGKLTFTGASDAVFDGSSDVTVNIPVAPPVGDAEALTFTGAVSATYDGSAPVTVNIPKGVAVKRYVAKQFPSGQSVASGTYTFDNAPSDYSASKCFLVQVGFYATSTQTTRYGTSYWSPSNNSADETVHQMFGWADGGSIKFYERSFILDLGVGSIYFGAGKTSNASGAMTTGETYCTPRKVVLYYLA